MKLEMLITAGVNSHPFNSWCEGGLDVLVKLYVELFFFTPNAEELSHHPIKVVA